MAPLVCECCGQIIPPQNPFVTSPIKARIYAFITKHPEGVTRDQIADHVYADDPNGGPEWTSTISVHIHWMNIKLSKLGLKIASPRGRSSNFRLRKLEDLTVEFDRTPVTPSLVREIKELYPVLKSHRKIAVQLGTSVGVVGRALNGHYL